MRIDFADPSLSRAFEQWATDNYPQLDRKHMREERLWAEKGWEAALNLLALKQAIDEESDRRSGEGAPRYR